MKHSSLLKTLKLNKASYNVIRNKPLLYMYLSKPTNEFKTHHSIASSRPSPLVAEVLNMDHARLFRAERPSALDTSEADMAPSISLVIKKKKEI